MSQRKLHGKSCAVGGNVLTFPKAASSQMKSELMTNLFAYSIDHQGFTMREFSGVSTFEK
jgi:hypothetical protein